MNPLAIVLVSLCGVAAGSILPSSKIPHTGLWLFKRVESYTPTLYINIASKNSNNQYDNSWKSLLKHFYSVLLQTKSELTQTVCTGTMCSRSADPFQPCSNKEKKYCVYAVECRKFVFRERPQCSCQDGYTGDRCSERKDDFNVELQAEEVAEAKYDDDIQNMLDSN